MTRQILAILIVVAIIVVIARVVMQSGTGVLDVRSLVRVPTSTVTPALQVVAPDANPLPTALPRMLATAVEATVQAATPRPVAVTRPGSSGRPLVLPNTGAFDQLSLPAQTPFIAFISIMCTVTAVGFWLGRNR